MKRYLIAGLLVWVPLGITLWVINFLVTTLDQTLLLVPENWRPEALVGFHIPGLGVLLSFVILFVTGVFAANFFGQRLILIWEGLLGRIPVVKSIYSSVKQVSDTVLSDQGTAFRKALLVEFPRPGCWTIAFMTGAPADAVVEHLAGRAHQRLRAHDAQPDRRLFRDAAEERRARARHVGRRRAQVHHFDGRGRAAPPSPGRKTAAGAVLRCRHRRQPSKLTGRGAERRDAVRVAARLPVPTRSPSRSHTATHAGECFEAH